MANSKEFKVEAPSIRAILCEFNYFFANLFADLQRNIMGSVLVIIYYTLGQICVNSPD
jgi:hypothetical protein